MNLSIVPPYSKAIDDISDRYAFTIEASLSGSVVSVISVNLTISEKNIVKFFLECFESTISLSSKILW